jgi:hypothetical protein
VQSDRPSLPPFTIACESVRPGAVTVGRPSSLLLRQRRRPEWVGRRVCPLVVVGVLFSSFFYAEVRPELASCSWRPWWGIPQSAVLQRLESKMDGFFAGCFNNQLAGLPDLEEGSHLVPHDGGHRGGGCSVENRRSSSFWLSGFFPSYLSLSMALPSCAVWLVMGIFLLVLARSQPELENSSLLAPQISSSLSLFCRRAPASALVCDATTEVDEEPRRGGSWRSVDWAVVNVGISHGVWCGRARRARRMRAGRAGRSGSVARVCVRVCVSAAVDSYMCASCVRPLA